MACQDCTAARSNHAHAWFDNAKCIHCAARLIQMIRTLPIGRTEASARSTAALKVATDAGFDEKAVRKLVSGPMSVEPIPGKEDPKPSKKASRK